jgi:hypothetical protein
VDGGGDFGGECVVFGYYGLEGNGMAGQKEYEGYLYVSIKQ